MSGGEQFTGHHEAWQNDALRPPITSFVRQPLNEIGQRVSVQLQANAKSYANTEENLRTNRKHIYTVIR